MKIGFLGPKGTFSHEALKKYRSDASYTACDYGSIQELLMAVRNKEVDEAIVPIENSIEGAVNATMDLMAFDVDTLIKSEFILPIKENLLVKKGTDLKNIKHILSHPQPFGQCRKFLSENFPKAEPRMTNSTAGAAQEVAAGCGDSAALGSVAAAEEFGLDIAVKDVHDYENNYTRFVILSDKDGERTGNDKTSIVFAVDDKPGSLYSILGIFSMWGINLNKIESRPSKDLLGRYIFFVDIKGHREDEDVRDALTMVKRRSFFYKFLGSYPVYSE